MDPTKSHSRGNSSDMSPTAVERRLETVDELRELAVELSQARRLGPIKKEQYVSEAAPASAIEISDQEK